MPGVPALPPIYVAALITLVVSAGLWLGIFSLMAGPWRRLAWMSVSGLPLSAVVNLWVKGPLAVAVGGAALWAGVYLGLGFGLGEVAYLAWGIAQSPAYAGYPFWYFGGFFGERLLVVYLHAALTGLAASGWARGPGRGFATYAAAVGLHALANLGAMLYQLKLTSAALSQITLVAAMLAVSVALERLRRAVPREPGEAPVVIFRREG